MSSEIFSAQTIHPGLTRSFEETVTAETIADFSKYSGDLNPLHNDPEFARQIGYPSVVAHGAIQQALLSRFAGMHIPGTYSILKKIDTLYLNPIFPGQRVLVKGTVKQWSEKNLDGELEIKISDTIEKTVFSINRVRFGLTGGSPAVSMASSEHKSENTRSLGSTESQGKKAVLLLGGSGGLGRDLGKYFEESGSYRILLSGRALQEPHFCYDPLTSPDEDLVAYCVRHEIFAVIHLASKKPVKQSPSSLDVDDLCENIKIHFRPLRALTEAIKSGQVGHLKRIICLGSSWGRQHFHEYGHESYGYVKALVSMYAQDLSRELARNEDVTLNVISPSELEVGMNAGMSERSKQLMGAKNPSGKMTTTRDIFKSIHFLCGEEASMIKGQEFLLSGGRTK